MLARGQDAEPGRVVKFRIGQKNQKNVKELHQFIIIKEIMENKELFN